MLRQKYPTCPYHICHCTVCIAHQGASLLIVVAGHWSAALRRSEETLDNGLGLQKLPEDTALWAASLVFIYGYLN